MHPSFSCILSQGPSHPCHKAQIWSTEGHLANIIWGDAHYTHIDQTALNLCPVVGELPLHYFTQSMLEMNLFWFGWNVGPIWHKYVTCLVSSMCLCKIMTTVWIPQVAAAKIKKDNSPGNPYFMNKMWKWPTKKNYFLNVIMPDVNSILTVKDRSKRFIHFHPIHIRQVKDELYLVWKLLR